MKLLSSYTKRWSSLCLAVMFVLMMPLSIYATSPQNIVTITQTKLNNPFPRKVLMELFTATWCGSCATYGFLVDDLVEELGQDKVILCRNQCRNDGLNTPETDRRYEYYQITGIPTVIMSGRFQSHPGEMEKNRNQANSLLNEKSPFRISMKYANSSIKINCLNGTTQSYDHLRLIVLLYEELVFYEGQNGEPVHKNVVRDYIEDEKGVLFPLVSNQSKELTVKVEYPLDSEKEFYFVCFLQDSVTKEVYQAERINAKISEEPLPDLQVLECILPDEIKESEKCIIKSLLINTGQVESSECSLRLYLSTKEDWNISDDLMIPEEKIPRLQAGATSELTFSFLFPDLGKGTYQVWILFLVDSRDEVRESDENNLIKWAKPITVQDVPSSITPPQAIAPKEGEEISLPYRFQWSHLDTASKYYLIFEKISNEESQTFTKLTNQADFMFQEGDKELIPGEEYRWSVIALFSAGGQSPASEWVKFSVNQTKTISVVITLQIGNYTALIQKDDRMEKVSIDVAPFLVNNRTIVPIRFIGESFGAEVRWNQPLNEIIMLYNQTMVYLWLENKQMKVVNIDDQTLTKMVHLEIPPFIMNNRTVVPLRVISEIFGAEVLWDSASRKIQIFILTKGTVLLAH